MNRSSATMAVLSALLASALVYADNGASKAPLAIDAQDPPSRNAATADSARPVDTSRVSGSNDIYRVKIRNMTDGTSDAAARDPSEVFGHAGYYLYDLNAWAMVSSGPIVGPFRGRSYSLFGSGSHDATLNRWTMRSESLRNDADLGAPWSYPGWRF